MSIVAHQPLNFTCLCNLQAIDHDSLSAIVIYNNCTDLQTANVLPRDHQGNNIGASVALTPLGIKIIIIIIIIIK